MPLDGVAVIGGELMMEVVVAFSERDEGGNDVVTGRVAVIERLVAEPVSERVDAESGLLDEEDAEDSGVEETAEPVAPTKAAREQGEKKAHDYDDFEVVAVLPNDDRVLIEIGNIGTANTLGILLHQHPPKVGVEETFTDGVWILVGVGVAVMRTVVSRPPSDRTLDGSTSDSGEEDPKW